MLWVVMSRLSDVGALEPDMLILRYRFDKYELNHRMALPEIQKYLCKYCKSMFLDDVITTSASVVLVGI